jgi:hypothetical protein
MVARPSRMKIHRQPSSPPIPSILMIAEARSPPKAPDKEAKGSQTPNTVLHYESYLKHRKHQLCGSCQPAVPSNGKS